MTNVHFGYGRTRRPKNIAGPDGTVAQPGRAYKTENQRFLTIYNTGENPVTQVEVRLTASMSDDAKDEPELLENGNPNPAYEGRWITLEELDQTQDPPVFVDVGVAAGKIKQIEILGVDSVRVTYALLAGDPQALVPQTVGQVYLACSTF